MENSKGANECEGVALKASRNSFGHIRSVLKKECGAAIVEIKENSFSLLGHLLCDIIIAVALFLIDFFDCYSILFGKLIDYSEASKYFLKIVDSRAFAVMLVSLAIALIIAIVLFGYHKLRLAILDKHLNRQDKFLLNILTIGLMYLYLLSTVGMIENRCLIKIGEYVMTIISGLLVIRVVVVSIIDARNNKKSSQLLSLSELYRGETSVKTGAVLISDNECDDDIFDRSITIDKIASIISTNTNGKSFTLSLVGPWGSGKSTIIKCVKRKLEKEKRKDIIFVDDFQPWIYKDSDTMVVELGNKLLEKIGYKKRFVSSRTIANAFLKITARKESTGILENIRLPEQKVDPIKIINDYLIGHNKKLVIVLDNLERCEPEQVVRFLRIVHNHLQFKNSCYIFSYDEEVMNAGLLKNGIYDRLFLDKFSQTEIAVPDIEASIKREVINTCLENYYATELSLDQKELVRLAAEIISTPRQLVHFINFCYVGGTEHLNPIDLMLLNVLRKRAPNLYLEIKRNKEKFIYNARIVAIGKLLNEEYAMQSINSYHDEEEKYFESLLKNDKMRDDLISNLPIIRYLFPSVEAFIEGKNSRRLFSPELMQQPYNKAYADRRLCIEEFFPSYFTFFKNEYIETSEIADKIINYPQEVLFETIWNIFLHYDDYEQRNNLTYINKRLKKIDESSRDYLATNLVEKLLEPEGYTNTKGARVQDTAVYFLSDLLFEVSDNTFNELLNGLKTDYRALSIMSSLDNYTGRSGVIRSSDRSMRISEAYKEMNEAVLNGVVDLYDADKYRPHNARCLKEKDDFISYLNNWKDSIDDTRKILMVTDFVYQEGGSGNYAYGIDHYVYKVFNENEIRLAIKNAHDSSLKSFVSEVFENAEEKRTTSITGDKYYQSKEYYDIIKLCNDYMKYIETLDQCATNGSD